MLPNGYVKLKYKHVACRHWPPKLNDVAFNLHGGYLPTYLVWLTLCKMFRMTIRKNHPIGLKRWNGNFSTMPKGILSRKFLHNHCLPLHDHFGDILMGFTDSTKS
jgi:hypothetical protein